MIKSFNTDDIKIVCEILIENCLYDNSDNTIHYGRYNDTACNYCDAECESGNPFIHDLNCPILIAKDLLTGLI